MKQSPFGRDVEAAFGFVNEVYGRIALFFMHVTRGFQEHGWEVWPNQYVITTAVTTFEDPTWWYYRFVGRAYVKSGGSPSAAPLKVLLIGARLAVDEKEFEPTLHCIALTGSKPFTKDGWNYEWYLDTVHELDSREPGELNIRREELRDATLMVGEPTASTARKWSPMERLEAFAIPLARLDSDEDVERLVISPAVALAEEGLEAAKHHLAGQSPA